MTYKTNISHYSFLEFLLAIIAYLFLHIVLGSECQVLIKILMVIFWEGGIYLERIDMFMMLNLLSKNMVHLSIYSSHLFASLRSTFKFYIDHSCFLLLCATFLPLCHLASHKLKVYLFINFVQ